VTRPEGGRLSPAELQLTGRYRSGQAFEEVRVSGFEWFSWSDIPVILALILLEGLLSGDNALVLAVLVLPLPEHQRRKALHYGILGAFVLRIIATFLAVWLASIKWVALIGGLYLLYLPFKHFTSHPDEEPTTEAEAAARATTFFGLSLFWTIVIKADLIDLVFAVDSILAAVGMSDKAWVIIAGGLLGILMMRMLTMQVLELVKRYPKLIDGAYIIVAWVGIKLLFEYFNGLKLNTTFLGQPIHFDGHHVVPHISTPLNVGVVMVLFVASFLYAQHHQKNAGLSAAIDDYSELSEEEKVVETREK
jgi:YkoY family integral membrane protein